MLVELHIRNLAVVEESTLVFEPGFVVLTGETGAGKSIVVDSLALLSGVRATTDWIRTGADTLSVTGVFRPTGNAWRQVLRDAGIESPDEEGNEIEGDSSEDDTTEIIVRREISRAGRNRVYVDDRPVTLKLLVALAPSILRIHGQREELGLIDPELQRTWLDRRGGTEGVGLTAEVTEAYEAWRAASRRLERLSGDRRARDERVDFLRFQLDEIDAAGLEPGEEVELRAERDLLRHGEAIRGGLVQASELLFDEEDASYPALAKALVALRDVATWDPAAVEWVTELSELEIRLGELEPALRRRLSEVDSDDPGRLDTIEARLATVERLLRKHRVDGEVETVADILSLRDRMAQEIDEIDDADAGRETLERKVQEALDAYLERAAVLSTARARWARELEERVSADLADLALERARFEVALETRRRESSTLQRGGEPIDFGPLGFDQVVYRFSPNPGEELRPLAKAASGGELSRLYLAVQLASRDGVDGAASREPTLVFDEVDAGISGAEAAILGRKLKRLARGGQVLAVTHLPQVASAGDMHLRVRKTVSDDDRTRTAVETLDGPGRIEEVARMLAGSEITDLSLEHARELIAGSVA